MNPDEQFEALCRRELRGEDRGEAKRNGLPPEWQDRRRRRVEHEVDFDLEGR